MKERFAIAFILATLMFAIGYKAKYLGRSVFGIGSPEIEILPSSIDLGDVVDGTNKDSEFKVANRSGRKIVITSVSTDCGCTTTTEVRNRELKAGESATIGVRYSANMHAASQVQKTVVVKYESNGRSQVVPIKLSGRVIVDSRLSVFPPVIDLGTLVGGGVARVAIYFRGDSKVLGTLPDELDVGAGSDPQDLRLNFGTSTLYPDIKKVYLVLRPPPFGSRQSMSHLIRILDTTPSSSSEIDVPIRVTIVPPIEIKPKNVAIFADEKTGLLICPAIKISNRNGEAIELEGVDSDLPVKFSSASNGATVLHLENVDFTKLTLSESGEGVGTLSIKLTHPQLILDVPIALIMLDHSVPTSSRSNVGILPKSSDDVSQKPQ